MNVTVHKRWLISLLIPIGVTSVLSAQSVTSIEDRLAKLEAQIAQQNTTIANLQSEVQSVVKQNLALKEALSLQPTIAEFKTDEFTYKLHNVVGDPVEKTVKLLFTITNTTGKDSGWFQFKTVKYIDENGRMNPTGDDYKLFLGGNEERYLTDIYEGAPVSAEIILENYDPKASYIKVLDGQVHKRDGINAPDRSFSFRNLPIKWVESTD